MLYPSKYVLLTDLDIKNKQVNNLSQSNRIILDEKVDRNCSCQVHLNDNSFSPHKKTYSDGIQKSTSGIMPERIWQDVIMNPAYTLDKSEHKNINNYVENSVNITNSCITENSIKTEPGTVMWNFAEPYLKNSCSCKR